MDSCPQLAPDDHGSAPARAAACECVVAAWAARRLSVDAIPELRRTNEEVRGLAAATRETVPGIGHTSDEVRELAKAVR